MSSTRRRLWPHGAWPSRTMLAVLWPVLVICVSGASSDVTRGHPRLPDEQRLLRRLFRMSGYDTSVRPVFNSSHNVEVTFNFNLIQIMDMDEKNQILTTNAWLESSWKDERISWDPDDFSGLRVFRLPASKLWLPDIVLYNNADDYTAGFMLCNAMVEFDGTINWSPPARLRSSCKVDITYFPFDSQNCHLKFGSWTYDKAQVDLLKRSDTVDIANYITNGEWRLTKYTIVRSEVVYPISSAKYPDVTIHLVIHRRILYYVLNILFPCFWLNILSVLTFCLPPDAGEKITLSITVLLSYSVFMLLVAESMPPTSEAVPLIEIYLTTSMAVASVSVILTVLVLKLHHCPPNQTEVPSWVRTLILGHLGRIVRCSCVCGDQGKQPQQPRFTVAPSSGREPSEVCDKLLSGRESGSERFRGTDSKSQDLGGVGGEECVALDYSEGRHSISRLHGSSSSSDVRVSLYENRPRDGLQEMLYYLRMIVEKNDKEDKEEDVIDEWKQVALVMDRLMFWIFLFITLFSTLLVLVVVPAWKYATDE